MTARALRRKLARIDRAAVRIAFSGPVGPDMRCPMGVRGWRVTLASAVSMAPELPVGAWARALATSWPIDGDMAGAVAGKVDALSELAAIFAKHGRGAEKLPRRARRRVSALLDKYQRGADEGDARPEGAAAEGCAVAA